MSGVWAQQHRPVCDSLRLFAPERFPKQSTGPQCQAFCQWGGTVRVAVQLVVVVRCLDRGQEWLSAGNCIKSCYSSRPTTPDPLLFSVCVPALRAWSLVGCSALSLSVSRLSAPILGTPHLIHCISAGMELPPSCLRSASRPQSWAMFSVSSPPHFVSVHIVVCGARYVPVPGLLPLEIHYCGMLTGLRVGGGGQVLASRWVR